MLLAALLIFLLALYPEILFSGPSGWRFRRPSEDELLAEWQKRQHQRKIREL